MMSVFSLIFNYRTPKPGFFKLKSRGYNETFFEKPRASSIYYGGGAIAKTILVPRGSKQEFTSKSRWSFLVKKIVARLKCFLLAQVKAFKFKF
ncbi:hypothetical protein BpHYR1_022910 [Brachionus plicatilis]|uniref:Uncharacterized protein n=1 Tax=Brachionus plicatilis TaxID=10195 RepID=A0A3M7T5P9_BRAPC|nr:hypothetical protein BpHYR1_022910 [Brachionus plicatilis]